MLITVYYSHSVIPKSHRLQCLRAILTVEKFSLRIFPDFIKQPEAKTMKNLDLYVELYSSVELSAHLVSYVFVYVVYRWCFYTSHVNLRILSQYSFEYAVGEYCTTFALIRHLLTCTMALAKLASSTRYCQDDFLPCFGVQSNFLEFTLVSSHSCVLQLFLFHLFVGIQTFLTKWPPPVSLHLLLRYPNSSSSPHLLFSSPF